MPSDGGAGVGMACQLGIGLRVVRLRLFVGLLVVGLFVASLLVASLLVVSLFVVNFVFAGVACLVALVCVLVTRRHCADRVAERGLEVTAQERRNPVVDRGDVVGNLSWEIDVRSLSIAFVGGTVPVALAGSGIVLGVF